MIIECSSCSQPGTERSNPQSEAREGKFVSRNFRELDSASLRYTGVVKLPEMLKPATIGEETFTSNQWAPRGVWRRRAMKEKSRNLRYPVLTDRESETFIVAKKDLINLEQREVTVGA